MATLTVWKFDFPTTADEAESTLDSLSQQGLITIHDAATISWAWGSKPKTRQLSSLTGKGALGGAFWGLLFGLLFFVPLLGAAVGAAAGGIGGSMRDAGIDDDFIDAVARQGDTRDLGTVRADQRRGDGQGHRSLRCAPSGADRDQPLRRGGGQVA